MKLISQSVLRVAIAPVVLGFIAVVFLSTRTQSSKHSSSLRPLTWDIGELGEVKMFVQDSHRYALDGELAEQDWANLVPGDGGIIHLTGTDQPFTISMFHQLRCLDSIRVGIVNMHSRRVPPNAVTHHCLNYIRQMVLCRSDLHLEKVRDPVGPHAVDLTSMHTCRDWRKVYTAADKNREEGR